jgi:hypothetical protein
MDSITTIQLSGLRADVQDEVDRWHDAFSGISGPVTKAFHAIALALGSTEGTVRERYYKWREGGRAALVNRAKCPDFTLAPDDGQVQEDTFEYYRQLCIENGRKLRPAYKKLVREFFEGKDIPGVPHGTSRKSLPSGWTESNFRRHAPSKFECKAARQGLRAASEFRPLVYTTRKEMYFFQELQFDDVWHDVECSLLDRMQRVRPLQLGAMEVFSACLFEWCVKPRIKRDDDTRTNLGPNDMLFLLGAIFGKYGHNPRGTRLNCEAGTAVPPDAAIDLIHKLGGGEVIVRIGEAKAEPAFLGQFAGVAKGNFRTRALIESFWNITHNETADRLEFPGQTGSHARVNAPEDLHGRAKEMDLMLRAMPALPEWVVKNLRKPLPEFNEAMRAIGEINERLNRRGIMPGTEHQIEGFVEAGLVTTDFDVPGIGLVSRADFEARLEGKSEAEIQAIIALCAPRARRLSPREAFDGHRSVLKRWRPEVIAALLYPARRDGVVRVGKDHLVTFDDKDISPEPLRFLAHHFSPGDEFEAVCNPMVPDLLFIYDARPAHRGAWIGVLKHWGRVSKTDSEAMGHRIGEAEKVKRELLRPLVQMGDRMAKERAENLEANNRQLTGLKDKQADYERIAREALQNNHG